MPFKTKAFKIIISQNCWTFSDISYTVMEEVSSLFKFKYWKLCRM